jgi:hypothetical protein
MFPYHIVAPGTNTPLTCINQCAAFGFSAAGVEWGQECFCGDITDVVSKNGAFVDDSQCNMPCDGDSAHSCGGFFILNVYYGPVVNTWKTPGNTGHYEYLLPGVVVPISASVSVNNKVLFLEKHGSGPPNSTGAYELDLTLVNNFNLAYRAMHVQTDLFCGANVVLPDKAGRQISVGGYNGVALSGVRLYTPDGKAGVNGTNDWEENFNILSLQRPRWYPTSAILANGSILTMGGLDIGKNVPQGNLEIFPKPAGGDTVVNLDWLLNTPNAMYPFVTILPSKNIFVAYYKHARILDPATFATITVLPDIPGAVDDPTGGRNYPLSGAFVPLPLSAPYTAPLKAFICGGSTPQGGALDNCVTIEPEAAQPTWTIERMPSKRVLPCLVPLPDGTILIVNGAHQGQAGFGAASDPNMNAVLYDPSLPAGTRFSILGSSTIARMYHSEATLLPDGRVLISGSDPQDSRFPEEYRVEVYVPPYLTQGLKQPTFHLPNNDWTYGDSFPITSVTLFQATTSSLRVSLVAAPSSTHGNGMGARTLFPAFSCSNSACKITAPPNSGVCPPGWYELFILDGPTPSVAQWVRIGGDPSQLGKWPDLTGFTHPGV